MFDFFARLFDATGFVPRRQCGALADEPGLVRLMQVSDLLIWLAYLAIPVVLVIFSLRHKSLPFRGLFWLFGAFIVACGLTHLLDAILLDHPMYRLAALMKVITAAVSWATVIALVPVVPQALALRSPEELQREIDQREQAQAELEEARQVLERRVAERTADLARANSALKAEVRERQKAEEERERLLASERQARSDAEEANRAKDEFLATLSHELRTPLNAMHGWVHLLRTGKLNEEMTTRGLEVLERNTRAQAQLIDDILDVSRIITGKLRLEPRAVQIQAVTEAAVDAIRPAAEARGVQLRLRLDAPTAQVLGDPTRLQQVCWNLLSNAVKFTGRNGAVEVTLRLDEGNVELAVRDEGAGIAAKLLPHVFERFRQGDSSSTRMHGGLGLGLAIVRHLVELHGGQVSAQSPGEGKGATFRVTLPALVGGFPTRASDPSLVAFGDRSVAGLRVLVVDDERDARELLTVVLSGAGAEVRSCAAANEALAEVVTFRPDVLVCDIGMPGEDGYSLIRKIRSLPPESGGLVPAVAVTAFARAEDRAAALAAGFQMHAPKPINPAQLLNVVRALAGWAAR